MCRSSSRCCGLAWPKCNTALQSAPMKRLLALMALAGVTAGCRDSVEAHFIYYPSRTLTADPSSVGLAFRNVAFTAADGVKLHGWLIPGRKPTTLIYYHGNGGKLAGRGYIARMID